jgi:hypothetical protein
MATSVSMPTSAPARARASLIPSPEMAMTARFAQLLDTQPLRIGRVTPNRFEISVFKCHHSFYSGSWFLPDEVYGKVEATISAEKPNFRGGAGKSSGSSTKQMGHRERSGCE